MQLMTWAQTFPLLAVITLALIVPGSAIALAAGRRNPLEVLTLGLTVSIALAGVDGIVFLPFHIPWGWPSYLLSALLVVVVVALIRSFHNLHRRTTLPMQTGDKQHMVSLASRLAQGLPALFGVLLTCVAVAVRVVHSVASPQQVTQNYDSMFHENIVGRIVMTGEASSLRAAPEIRNVYPIAMQQFAALGAMAFGRDASTWVTASLTCTCLVFAALIWPMTMIYLVRAIVGRHALIDFLAPVLSVTAAGGSLLLWEWGTLYSMFAGQVVAPVLIALLWQCCGSGWQEAFRLGGKQRWHRVYADVAWIVIAGLAVSMCHFRVVITVLLICAPLLVLWVVEAAKSLHEYHRPVFKRVCITVTIVVLLLVALALNTFRKMYLWGSRLKRPISDHLNGGPALPTENIPSAALRWLLGQPINSGNNRLPVYWPTAILTLAALALAVVVLALAAVARSAQWKADKDPQPSQNRSARPNTYEVTQGVRTPALLLASFLLTGLVFVSCAGTHADWAKVLTALWYKDQRRVYAAWPIIVIPLISWALLEAERRLGERVNLGSIVWRGGAVVLALVLAVVCVAVNPQMDEMASALGHVYAFAANDSDNPMLSGDEFELMRRVNNHVPANQPVLSDPWNGSGYLLAVGGHTSYYKHLYMFAEADRDYLAPHFNEIKTDPNVCRILDKDNVHWFLDMGGSYAPNDPSHAMFENLKMTPGTMKPVDRQGQAVLYRITACPAQR